MGSMQGFFLLLLTAAITNAMIADARTLQFSFISGARMLPTENMPSEVLKRDGELCALCEDYATRAMEALAENKTRDDIIDFLHQRCAAQHSFEQQCIHWVDYYAPLFFKMVSNISPEELCTKVTLCRESAPIALQKSADTCSLCHDAIVQILIRLRDPDKQLEVIQILLKSCDKTEKYARECKKLVFHYGPLILLEGEKFFESTDVCASINACKPSKVTAIELKGGDLSSREVM